MAMSGGFDEIDTTDKTRADTSSTQTIARSISFSAGSPSNDNATATADSHLSKSEGALNFFASRREWLRCSRDNAHFLTALLSMETAPNDLSPLDAVKEILFREAIGDEVNTHPQQIKDFLLTLKRSITQKEGLLARFLDLRNSEGLHIGDVIKLKYPHYQCKETVPVGSPPLNQYLWEIYNETLSVLYAKNAITHDVYIAKTIKPSDLRTSCASQASGRKTNSMS